MLFSHSAAYAIRALVWLACQPKETRWLATDVAREERIPQPYLSKVLGTLKAEGFVNSIRGPRGGYALAEDPSRITLRRIASLFDSEDRLNECMLAYGECGSCNGCPMSALWHDHSEAISSFLDFITIEALAMRSKHKSDAGDDTHGHA